MDPGSVTLWLNRLTTGDREALGPLWERYYERVVSLARTRLRRLDVRAADEEDVAASAFYQFYRSAADNGFARLENRDDLWQVLAVLTGRKALDYHKYESRGKRRGGGGELPVEVAGGGGDPAAATLAADEVQILFERLPDDQAREVARLKLECHSNKEIADRLGCTVRTVTRRLALIRSIWGGACP
ncbi:ECF-type sigma factor [Frigoriglobus tundricola]|uniref:RNA polymerase ECF-type sigma factor n=1 Tax=Frigoriglobus tundricola TaxID=2774151 RepID=A0A6M5YSM8_9BACT|nr:ECF-type sigma factor [Frigoriglobus tundricola]QJW96869.1 RNA polymerase ECF-type sigma factor [Frigoriglobus tundricola]